MTMYSDATTVAPFKKRAVNAGVNEESIDYI
jgi:hypothetical protein